LFYVIGRSSTGNSEYFYKDNQTGKLFQIKNVFEDLITENTYCSNSILMIYVENGHDYFDGSNRPYGVHLEIDLAKGKLIRALPFGYLSFPKRIKK
jgi:hypothetical protein